MVKIKLIVGLGNPGELYENTRHNVGFWVLDAIAQQFNVSFRMEKKFSAELTSIRYSQTEVMLIKPTTFMNLSGQAVVAIVNYFNIRPQEILVIHDELDLAAGRLKLKQAGSHGGHNGLKDIDSKLASNAYYRLRVGIGHPRDLVNITEATVLGVKIPSLSVKNQAVSHYVLKKPSVQQQKQIDEAIDKIIAHLESILTMDLTLAQRQLHTL